jgi:hypothetical protein
MVILSYAYRHGNELRRKIRWFFWRVPLLKKDLSLSWSRNYISNTKKIQTRFLLKDIGKAAFNIYKYRTF